MPDRALAIQEWSEVPAEFVHLAFLQAEWSRFPSDIKDRCRGLVEAPDMTSLAENQMRFQLLWARRRPLLERVPQDTRWHEVRYLTTSHLGELLVIGRCGWDDPADRNELCNVAARRRVRLLAPPESWQPPILWAHDESGPFTILEANNRLVAYAGQEHFRDMKIRVYVGLSRAPCYWHLPDSLLS